MANPIWKDYFVTLGTGDYVEYRVRLQPTREIIFIGRAYRRPGEDNIVVKINDICSHYFKRIPPKEGEVDVEAKYSVQFSVEVNDGSTWRTIVNPVEFTDDWSYVHDFDPSVQGIAFPINGNVEAGQMIVHAVASNATTISVRAIMKDGTEQTNTFNVYNHRVVIPGDYYEDVEKVIIGHTTYHIVEKCATYALYYVNVYGGWDSLLIEGNSKMTEDITRHEIDQEYDNRQLINRGRKNNVNEITRRITLYTGLIGDLGAVYMHNLLTATDVYLYDIWEGTMTPVVLTNTTCEHLTYHNNGNNVIRYTIEVEIAHNMIRK